MKEAFFPSNVCIAIPRDVYTPLLFIKTILKTRNIECRCTEANRMYGISSYIITSGCRWNQLHPRTFELINGYRVGKSKRWSLNRTSITQLIRFCNYRNSIPSEGSYYYMIIICSAFVTKINRFPFWYAISFIFSSSRNYSTRHAPLRFSCEIESEFFYSITICSVLSFDNIDCLLFTCA